MGYKTIQNDSTEILLGNAGKTITELLKGKDTLLLLSGGSALGILEKIDESVLGKNITISVLDERYSTNPAINNFSQIMQTSFYRAAIENEATFIDTRILENETIDNLAERFEHSLRNWKTAHPNGIIVATQGIGPDGHTAGIMPFPADAILFTTLFCEERWVVGYDVGSKNQYPLRVTTTITFLKLIDHSVLYVTGENKKEVLQKTLSKDTKLNECPSSIIREMKDVVVFTDQKILSI